MMIVGVDLAWGDKKRDGVCFIEADHHGARVSGFAYPQGDDELIASISSAADGSPETFITVDAPIVCPNRTGTRPVDRLTHRLFHREHAACHPANSTKCPRPPRVLRRFTRLGFEAGWNLRSRKKVVAEVYPHPAMVRLFKLDRIVKYKKGPVANRRREFRRLQRLIGRCLKDLFPFLRLNKEARDLLNKRWTKAVEDQTDALFCALIGLWHWYHNETRSDPIGDVKTGFILLPEDLRA